MKINIIIYKIIYLPILTYDVESSRGKQVERRITAGRNKVFNKTWTKQEWREKEIEQLKKDLS